MQISIMTSNPSTRMIYQLRKIMATFKEHTSREASQKDGYEGKASCTNLPSAILVALILHSFATVVCLSPLVINLTPTCHASIPCSDPGTRTSQHTFF